MSLPTTLTVPVHFRAELATYILMAFVFAIGAATAYLYRAQSVTVTRTVKQSIQSQYGKPSAVVPGAQVNASFSKLTCDVYQSGPTVICHP